MEPSKWRPTSGTVLGLCALVVALTGTAIAGPLAVTSILDKKEKKQVRAIAKAQVTKLAPGLAVASAKNANAAANADKLDGNDATAFTPAEEVHSPARLVMNDTTPGDDFLTTSTMLVVGQFTIAGNCAENIGGSTADEARLTVARSGFAGTSFAGPHSGSGVDNDQVDSVAGTVVVATVDTGSVTTNQVRGGQTVAVAPDGQVLSVSGSAEFGDPAGDCVFGFTAIGP